MIAATAVRTWELDRTPDLVDLVSSARDAGHDVMLIERPMPDAVSIAALGRVYDIVAARGGVALEAAAGNVLDFEPGDVVLSVDPNGHFLYAGVESTTVAHDRVFIVETDLGALRTTREHPLRKADGSFRAAESESSLR